MPFSAKVTDKYLLSFGDICLFVEDEKIICSGTVYVTKGDYIMFEAPTTLVATKISLLWPENQQFAAVSEIIITFGFCGWDENNLEFTERAKDEYGNDDMNTYNLEYAKKLCVKYQQLGSITADSDTKNRPKSTHARFYYRGLASNFG